MISSFRFRDKWIWEPVFSLVFVLFALLVSLISIWLFFLEYGLVSLVGVLVFIPVAFLIFRFQKINKMIEVLKGCISAQNGEVVASLLSIKNKPIPGVAILRKDVFILIPILGRRHKIFFDKIKTIEETKKIPGKWLIGKRSFNVEFEAKPSVAFAVPESVGKRWAVIFHDLSGYLSGD